MNAQLTLNLIAQRMTGADDALVGDGILEYLTQLPAPIQKDIRQLIVLFEYLPPLVIFKLSRFSKLSAQNQDRYIEAWGTSNIALLRTGFRVLKNLSVSTYYQNPATWKALGFER